MAFKVFNFVKFPRPASPSPDYIARNLSDSPVIASHSESNVKAVGQQCQLPTPRPELLIPCPQDPQSPSSDFPYTDEDSWRISTTTDVVGGILAFLCGESIAGDVDNIGPQAHGGGVALCSDICPVSKWEEREMNGYLDQYERLDGDRNQSTMDLPVKKLRTRALASLHSDLQNNHGVLVADVAKWLGLEKECIERLLEYHGFSIKKFDELYMVKDGPFLHIDEDFPTRCSGQVVHLKKSKDIIEDVSSPHQLTPKMSSPEAPPKSDMCSDLQQTPLISMTRNVAPEHMALAHPVIANPVPRDMVVDRTDCGDCTVGHCFDEEVAKEKIKLFLRLWRIRGARKREFHQQNGLAANATPNSISGGAPVQRNRDTSQVITMDVVQKYTPQVHIMQPQPSAIICCDRLMQSFGEPRTQLLTIRPQQPLQVQSPFLYASSVFSGFHGTTIVALKCKEGYAVAVESRYSNEVLNNRRRAAKEEDVKGLQVNDNYRKQYKISKHTIGVLVGNARSVDLKDYLMEKCSDEHSVQQVLDYAIQYLNKLEDKSKIFGTLICGSDLQGSCSLFSVVINKEGKVVTSSGDYIALGSGAKYADKRADELRGEGGFDHEMSYESAELIVRECCFHGTLFDISSGGPICVYRVQNARNWRCTGVYDVLDTYEQFYDLLDERKAMFLLVDMENPRDKSMIPALEKQFGTCDELEACHRTCDITYKEDCRFYFHRILFKSLIQNFEAVKKEHPTLKVEAIDEFTALLKEFYVMNLPMTEGKSVLVYVSRASKKRIELLKNCRKIIYPHPQEVGPVR